MMDTDDTTDCPMHDSCESCGDADCELGVSTVDTPIGVFCLTLCNACVVHDRMPRFALSEASRRTLMHCEHLDITADEMEAASSSSTRRHR